MNRYDLVCRALPTTEFWTFIVEDIGSRYVVFEFKNYKKKISQGQILTTEKYLMPAAMRKVAFIVTRLGADKNSLIFASGAMREHGKLIQILSDDDLCEMLHLKDAGDDANDYLFRKVDDFMLALPR